MSRISSPCVSICALDEQDMCLGCYRTATEITYWGRYNDDEKRQVLERVAERERRSFNFTATLTANPTANKEP